MSYLKTDAVVLHEVKYKESDRMLTLYSADMGKFTAKAQGALKTKGKLAAGTQMLTYSGFVLREFNGRLMVSEASVIEDFHGLRSDIENLALGCYFAECVSAFAEEDSGSGELLQLLLNCLYALSRSMCDRTMIKAAFELRLCTIEGYSPSVDCCCSCGRPEPDDPVLCIPDGRIYCRECCRSFDTLMLDTESLAALRHIVTCPAKKLLSFRCGPSLIPAAEKYFIHHSSRSYSSLDYYKALIS